MNHKLLCASVLSLLAAHAVTTNAANTADGHRRAPANSMTAAGNAYRQVSLDESRRTVGSPVSSPARDAALAPSDRMPVVSLSSTLGDVGFEIFDGKTRRYGLATLPKGATDAVVYIDVDSVSLSEQRMKSVLKLANDVGWVVMAESGTWNVPRLHAFLAKYYPDVNTKGLKNVAVRIGSAKGRAVVTDLTPSEAAVEVGIDYANTSQGQAEFRNSFTTKAIAPGSVYAWFANAAYSTNPGNRAVGNLNYIRVVNLDVLKVWSSYSSTTGYDCVVAWRGSNSTGDWLRNIESQFGTVARVPGESTSNEARIGRGYADRLNNYLQYVGQVNCGANFKVTGHSLGGGMAEAHAYTLRRLNRLPIMESYNPARVGNWAFRTNYMATLGTRSKVFCRHGDPVWGVPAALYHVGSDSGCTYWGARASWVNPVANHSMTLWL